MRTADYELFIIIYFVISIVIAIVFFVMAANINRIKNDIKDIKKIGIRYAKKDGIDLT